MLQMKEMPYHCGLKVKIYPSNEQKRLIAVNDGVKRAVYNHLVACGNEKYRLNKCASFVPAYQQRLSYLETVTGALCNIKNAFPLWQRCGRTGHCQCHSELPDCLEKYEAAAQRRSRI